MPTDTDFMNVVKMVLAEIEPVFVHCAVGHARSASVVAAVVIRKGLAVDVDSAEALLRRKRPGIRLNRLQRQQVKRLTAPSIAGAARSMMLAIGEAGLSDTVSNSLSLRCIAQSIVGRTRL